MDEEKQQDGMMKKTGDALKKGAKKQAKNLAKKILKKVIMMVLTFVLKAVLPIIIAIIILTTIANFLDELFSGKSKEANAFAVKYSNGSSVGSSSSGITEKTSLYTVVVDTGKVTENGAYELTYEFRDDNENLYSEEQAITNIKSDLLKENENLDINKFSEAELKAIGVLMYNGLKVKDCDEEELKAFAMFLKADIASQSFDLRTGNDTDIDIKDLKNNDYVYGTIQINKTKIEKDSNGNVAYSDPEKLKYVSYKEFSNMIQQNNEEALHSFSTDEEGNLVYAKWSTSKTDYTYHPYQNIETKLSNEEFQKIPQDNIKENKEKEIKLVMSTPYNYRQDITPYLLNYGLLSDLLTVTDNAQFCLDLAEMAFNSKIVINIREELEMTETNLQTDYVQTKLLYDYVKYAVADEINEPTTWEKIKEGTGSPNNDQTLKSYGWSSTMTPGPTEGGSQGGTATYQWTHNNIVYKLTYISTTSNSKWTLYKGLAELSNKTEADGYEYEDGDLINLKHIKEEYSDYTIDEGYTDSEIFKYTELEKTYFEDTRSDIGVSEVDCWYLKQHKKYENPTKDVQTSNYNQPSVPGEYSEELQLVLKTDNKEEINKDVHVEGFKEAYKNKNSVDIDVTCLTIKQRLKTDSNVQCTSETITYSFGQKEADTSKVQFKNVKYGNGEKVFTDEDEKGFLSIYNKYRQQGIDLYLEDDAEKQLFDLLLSDKSTEIASDIIKGLLFIYDGKDRGITNLENLEQLVSIKDMSSNSATSLVDYIFDYINYFEGSTPIEGDYYIAKDLGDGCITIGHGVTSYVLQGLQDGEKRPIEEIDAIEKDLIRDKIKIVRQWNPKLTNYQIVAVVSFMYNCGDYTELEKYYIDCWDQERDNRYVEGITEADIPFLYRANSLLAQRRGGTTKTESDINDGIVRELKAMLNTELYSQFYAGYCRGSYNGQKITYGGLVYRRYAEFMMFQYAYNAIDGTFYTNSLAGWEGEIYSNGSYSFPVYKQDDPEWAEYTYGGPIGKSDNRTIKSSGCGCVAVSIVLSGFTGELITPKVLTDKLNSLTNNNTSPRYYTSGEGSERFVGGTEIAEAYGCVSYDCRSWSEAKEALEKGAAVIACQQEPGGHIFAIVPADPAKGTFRVIDGWYYGEHSREDHNKEFDDIEGLKYIKKRWKKIVFWKIIGPPGYEK